MGTLRFEIRSDKKNASGLSPVRLVYSIEGQRVTFPARVTGPATNWVNEKQRFAGSSKLMLASELAEVNRILDGLENTVRNIETRFRLDNVAITPETMRVELEKISATEKKDDPALNVVAFIRKFAAESIATHKIGTLKAYTGIANHLEGFEKASKSKITFEGLSRATIKAFEAYLVQNMLNVTAAKQISTLKTLVNYARKDYGISVNPAYQDYTVSRGDSGFEVITLTRDELEKIYTFDLSGNVRLDRVRDVFVFSCVTGLRYSDIAQLRREHIRAGAIKLTVAKTGVAQEIPLNAISAAIIEKYATSKTVLPVVSNQKSNKYLKELCQLVGLDSQIEIVRFKGPERVVSLHPKYELISMHTGRKTFTTLSLEGGMAAQEVMSITGHKTWAAFRRYVDVANKRRAIVMHQVWGKPESKLKAI